MMIMSHGGSRNRSGPAPDANSGRSEARGYSLQFLPPEGYDGTPPSFPLPNPSDRELAVWRELWSTPQACAWSLPSERWRWRSVAMYARLAVRCEQPDAAAATMAQLHRFADQIGMTTAGLREMGWRVASVPAAVPAVSRPAPEQRPRRLRAVGDDQ
jgi:hypothetical protein